MREKSSSGETAMWAKAMWAKPLKPWAWGWREPPCDWTLWSMSGGGAGYKIKEGIIQQFTSGVCTQENWKTLYINAHSSITHNSQKMETTQIKHSISIQHNVIQHSAIKRNVIVIRAIAWMNLANVLNERSQVQKKNKKTKNKKTPMMWFHLHERSTMGKSIQTERLVIS